MSSKEVGPVPKVSREVASVGDYDLIDHLKAHEITDGTSGVRLVPFLATPDQLARVVPWSMNPEDPYTYMEGKPKDSAEANLLYKLLMYSGKTVAFEIITPDRSPVGFLSLYRIDVREKNAHVGVLVGEKDQRMTGIGSRATQMLFARAKDLGLQTAYAEVHGDNEASVRIFRRFPSRVAKISDYPGWILFTADIASWKPPTDMRLSNP